MRRRRNRLRTDLLVVPAKMLRMCDARARKVRSEFDRLDSLPPIERRLIQYYGARRAGEALSKRNPEDVAGYLGDKAGFERYCADLDAALPKKAEPKLQAAVAWAAFRNGA